MKNLPPKKSQIEAIEALEKALDRLKLAYEKYFRGIERRPPVHERAALEREVREFFRSPPRSAAARFRFSNFRQRMTALETYWNRVMRQIEEGTYERDVRRARARLGESRPERRKETSAIELDLDLELDFDMEELFEDASKSLEALFEESPPAPPKPASGRAGAPPPVPSSNRTARKSSPSLHVAPPPPPISASRAAVAPPTPTPPRTKGSGTRAIPPAPPAPPAPRGTAAPPPPPVPAAAVRPARAAPPAPPASPAAAAPPKAKEG